MKNLRLWIGIIICIVLFLLAVKWRKHEVIKKRNAPIVSIVKEWEANGKPVVTERILKRDVPAYTKVTSWQVGPNMFEGHVSKTVRDQLQIGQEMVFTVDGETFEGKIERVSENISLDTGMYPVFVKMPFEYDIKGSLVALAHTDTIKNVINIDDEIADYEDGKYFVWTIEQSKAKRVEITVFSRDSFGLIVSNGLKEGDFVVVAGYSKLVEGDMVKILEAKEGGPNQ